MLGDTTRRFQGKGTDLAALQGKIEDYLRSDGFVVQSSPPRGEGALIQARKGGFLSEIIAADRALSIAISGGPDDFSVRIGIGRWLEHIATAVVEGMLLSGLFLVLDSGEMLWNLEIEQKLVAQIESLVG